MKVSNMQSRNGNSVPNQFTLHAIEKFLINGEEVERAVAYFQSYSTIIVKSYYVCDKYKVQLDRDKWDYSVTTGRYRNQFLGESKAETQKKIDSGEYELVDLNN